MHNGRLSWTTEGEVISESYVNMIPTRQGGDTRFPDLEMGCIRRLRVFIDHHAMGQRGFKGCPR